MNRNMLCWGNAASITAFGGVAALRPPTSPRPRLATEINCRFKEHSANIGQLLLVSKPLQLKWQWWSNLPSGPTKDVMWFTNVTTLWVKKTSHYNLAHNVAKCWLIFKFFSPRDSWVNFLQTIINYPTTPYMCHYTTLWIFNVQKMPYSRPEWSKLPYRLSYSTQLLKKFLIVILELFSSLIKRYTKSPYWKYHNMTVRICWDTEKILMQNAFAHDHKWSVSHW